MRIRMKLAKSPVGYLTEGNEYEVVSSRKERYATPMLTIRDDEGDLIEVRLQGSAHLEGGDWEVVA